MIGREELSEEEKKERAERCLKGWNKMHDDYEKLRKNANKAYNEEFYEKHGYYPDLTKKTYR